MRQITDDESNIEFVIHLCKDVILEVLCSGDRRRLIKLERAGNHLQRLVENFFKQMPFLRLDFHISPGF